MKLKLRDYQLRGLDDIRAGYREKLRALLYVLPTGGGKTVTYAAIAEGAALRNKRALILEHRKELIRQASMALAGLGIAHRVVASAKVVNAIRKAHVKKFGWPFINQTAAVAVASVQTLARNMEWLAEFAPDLLVIDEAHHAVAGTWKKIITACLVICAKMLILGVTATPCRTNGDGLGEVFHKLILGPSPRELIADGWLLRPRVVSPPVIADFSKVRRGKDGDLNPDDQADALDRRDITGDAIEHYERLAPGRPAIVFASNLGHAANVAAQFRESGWRFEVIHGDLDDDVREKLIEDLATGAIHGLVSKDLISEGTDIPVAEVAIMLRRTESEGMYLQMCGRVLRPVFAPGFDLETVEGRLAAIEASGKPYGLIIDHVGNCGRLVNGEFMAKHGRPHDDREWCLKGRRKARAAEKVAPMLRCPECYDTDPTTPACACGHQFTDEELGKVVKIRRLASPPKYVDGVLQDVPDDAEAVAKMEARRAQAASKTVEAMVAATGMDPGRAAHIIEAREEKDRLRNQLRDLADRWYREARLDRVSLGRALREAFDFGPSDINGMKPKALRAAVEQVTEELLRLQFGAPPDDNAIVIRGARKA